MSTVPIFAPDGTLGDIPAGQLAGAVKAGAKPGVHIFDPDGKPGVVPADRYADAVKAGAKVAPFQEQEIKHPGFWSALKDDFSSMLSAPNREHLESGRVGAATQLNEAQKTQSATEDIARQQAGRSGAYRIAAPVAGALSNVPGQEQSAAEGDIGGVLGHAALTPLMMAISEGLARGVPPIAKAVASSPTASIPIRLAARSAETAINQKLIPLRPLANIMTPADEAAAMQFKVPGRDLGLSAPSEPSAALGTLKSRPAVPQPMPSRMPTKMEVETALSDALGGKPLQPNVPIRKQMTAATPSAPALPKDFTPVESSAVRGFKYDAASKEFETITSGGQHYVYGDVSPQEAEAFQSAESKGLAWQKIRNNPLVAKVINGKRVAMKPSRPTSEAGYGPPKADFLGDYGMAGIPPENLGFNPNPAPDLGVKVRQQTQQQMGPLPRAKPPSSAVDDLTDILQQSLEAAKKKSQ